MNPMPTSAGRRRLSSPATFFYKRVLPLIWVALLLVIGVLFWRDPQSMHGMPRPWVLPLVLALITLLFFGLWRWQLHGLADEVWLEGDALRVEKGGEDARIELSEILDVATTRYINPRHITLTLRNEGRFGGKVTFIPATVMRFLDAFRPDPIVLELRRRVMQAPVGANEAS